MLGTQAANRLVRFICSFGLTCFNNLTWGYNGYIVDNEWWLDTTSLWVINNNILIIALLKFQNNNRWLPNNIPIIIYQ